MNTDQTVSAESLLQDFLRGLRNDQRVVFEIYSSDLGGTRPVTSIEFADLIERWRVRLERERDSIVPIFGRMTPSMLAAYFGVMLAGKLPAFISYPNSKISREDYLKKLENYKDQFQNTVFIAEDEDAGQVPEAITPKDLPEIGEARAVDPCSVGAPCTPDAPCTPSASCTPSAFCTPDAPLFLQCTSGSTGLQKSVAITADLLCAQIDQYSKAIRLSSTDKIVSWLPLYHDMGLIATFLIPLFKKVPIVYIDPFDWVVNPGILLKLIESHGGTLTWMPNFAFSFLCKVKAGFDLSGMRSFINCSEPAGRAAFERFIEHHGVRPEQLSVCYAMAENVFAVTQTAVGEEPVYLPVNSAAYARGRIERHESSERVVVSCGSMINGSHVKIDCKDGLEVGEILIAGECAIAGYFRRPPQAENGWFRTGDIGFLHKGQLYVSGRVKDLIINQGKNIYPQDVEELVNGFEEVHQGRVVALGNYNEELDSEQVLVLFEPDRTMTLSEKTDLSKRVKDKIDVHFDISSLAVAVPKMWLSKTSSGKIARQSNLEKYLKSRDRHIHIIGDSHVRLLWTEDRSYKDTLKNVHSHWVGVFWSGELHRFDEPVLKIVSTLDENDILIFQAGEPECRVIFPGAEDPDKAVDEAVARYEDYFHWIRQHWKGTLAFMTGVPTRVHVVGPDRLERGKPDDHAWDWDDWNHIVGTPEKRYTCQERFYARMRQLCDRLHMPFIDACYPFLTEGRYLPDKYLNKKDWTHLKREYKWWYFDWLDDAFGFVCPDPVEYEEGASKWDHTYEHFVRIMQQAVQRLSSFKGEIDYDHLLSSGVLDSLDVIELIAVLQTTFNIDIELTFLRRNDFESISNIYNRFKDQLCAHEKQQGAAAGLQKTGACREELESQLRQYRTKLARLWLGAPDERLDDLSRGSSGDLHRYLLSSGIVDCPLLPEEQRFLTEIAGPLLKRDKTEHTVQRLLAASLYLSRPRLHAFVPPGFQANRLIRSLLQLASPVQEKVGAQAK